MSQELLVFNCIFLVCYVSLLVFILYRIFRMGGNYRTARILAFGCTCLIFSNVISFAVSRPITDMIGNIEIFHYNKKALEDINNWKNYNIISFYQQLQIFPFTGLLIAYAVGFLLYYFFIYCYRKTADVVSIPAPRDRSLLLVALTATVLLFNVTFQKAVTYPFGKIQSVYSAARDSAAWTASVPYTSTPQASDSTSGFPLGTLVIAICFGIILYRLLLFVRDKSDANTKAIRQMRLLNTIISLILAFSLFLVISVFITIPYLSEMRKPTIYSAAKLDSTLSNIARNENDSMAIPASNGMAEVLDTTTVTRSAAFIKMPESRKEQVVNQLQYIANDWANAIKSRNGLTAMLKQYRDKNKGRQDIFVQQLLNNFEIASQNLTSDKAALYQYAVNRFITYRQSVKNSYDGALNVISNIDNSNEQRKNEMINYFKQRIESDTNAIALNYSYGYFLSYIYTLYETDNSTNLQPVNRDGSEWGFLGLMSRYLIRTQSSELVLLIGMLGFGLLGASILSFQKSKEQDFVQAFSTTPLIKDFGSVMARGFGAALIVYLATKGGLAIFSMGTGAQSDPNGYILLLTCFIGAVYSEKVWARISNTFTTPPAANTAQQAGTGSNEFFAKNITTASSEMPLHDESTITDKYPSGPPTYLS